MPDFFRQPLEGLTHSHEDIAVAPKPAVLLDGFTDKRREDMGHSVELCEPIGFALCADEAIGGGAAALMDEQDRVRAGVSSALPGTSAAVRGGLAVRKRERELMRWRE